MARKFKLIILLVIAIGCIMAVGVRGSLKQKDVTLYTKEFSFLAVYDSETVKVPSERQIDEEMEMADMIAIVRPTDMVQSYAYIVLQKVEIVKLIKGNELDSNEIWISTMNGIYNGNNWGITNIMYPDYEYYIFLRNKDGKYYNDFSMGAICLEPLNETVFIDTGRKYKYEDLKHVKYFAENEDTLMLLFERENYILKKVNKEYVIQIKR